ncbi:hypothetical protein HPB48_020333 [Haemaphysalis longicornis]|uniref:Uncharacterized protein n=1 Tax=Haemaphysalis longicornis TaxID=44386 RepID=A0A9J6GRE3_HAELO|nr:hypothetical protein HPB48_020333 [Haemaphysalis longicornis]
MGTPVVRPAPSLVALELSALEDPVEQVALAAASLPSQQQDVLGDPPADEEVGQELSATSFSCIMPSAGDEYTATSSITSLQSGRVLYKKCNSGVELVLKDNVMMPLERYVYVFY